jgi:catechol 2,3-dioxygenase
VKLPNYLIFVFSQTCSVRKVGKVMVESVLKDAKLRDIAIRVNHRDEQIDFYQNVLKFRLLNEENALAIFGTQDSKRERFVIEESPAHRTHAVDDGVKKLHSFSILLPSKEELIATLAGILEQGYPILSAWIAPNGLGFSLLDTEENLVELYYSDAPIGELEKQLVDPPLLLQEKACSVQEYFSKDARIETVHLNVLDTDISEAFYEKVFGLKFNNFHEAVVLDGEETFCIVLHEAKGKWLVGNTDKLWDIEYFEFEVTSKEKIQAFAKRLDDLEVNYYLDKNNTILTVSDVSGLEWWFTIS